MIAAAILAGLVCAFLYFFIYCVRPVSLLKSCIKTASVLALSLAAYWAHAPGALVAALALSALGDWLLSRGSEGAFLAGVGAFAAAHLAYVWLMMAVRGFEFVLGWPAVVLLGLGAVMVVVMFRFAGALRWPVLGYVAVILLMGVTAFGLPQDYALELIAALVFVASDTVLAFELFVLPKDSPVRAATPYLVWGLYWTAQMLFLVAFVLVWVT